MDFMYFKASSIHVRKKDGSMARCLMFMISNGWSRYPRLTATQIKFKLYIALRRMKAPPKSTTA